MNTEEPLSWPDPFEAERRALRMQAKLHQWAAGDPGRCFDDLFVRHEAPCIRAEVEDHCLGLVAAKP